MQDDRYDDDDDYFYLFHWLLDGFITSITKLANKSVSICIIIQYVRSYGNWVGSLESLEEQDQQPC